MSRDIAPFPVRIPPELRERLEASRTSEGRSLNAEIVHRLQQSFAGQPTDEQVEAFLERQGVKPSIRSASVATLKVELQADRRLTLQEISDFADEIEKSRGYQFDTLDLSLRLKG